MSNGELIVTPSSTQFHNTIRDDLNSALRAFVKQRKLGAVTCGADLTLGEEIVRRPDAAFIRTQRLEG